MGEVMFGNELFDHWLNQKSLEILSKVEKEKISTEDMLILSLKAQTNHFHHMDEEFRGEFKKIDLHFEQINEKFERRFDLVDEKFERRFDLVDKKFDRLYTALMWGFGLMFTSIFGLYIKTFLG
jgi:hypothetical protein